MVGVSVAADITGRFMQDDIDLFFRKYQLVLIAYFIVPIHRDSLGIDDFAVHAYLSLFDESLTISS